MHCVKKVWNSQLLIRIYISSQSIRKKIAFGSLGFPWTADFTRKDISYAKGICPIAEKLNDETYLGFSMCAYDLTNDDIDLVIEAFHKVWDNLDQLK